jgi:hypothetical protein
MIVIVDEGEPIELGTTETAPTIGIVDYSRRVTDDFGVTTVVERGFARRMSVRLALPFDDVDGTQSLLADLRATSAQWVADDRFAWLQPTGFYKDFEVDLAVPPLSYCTLTIEGLAEGIEVDDDGTDPAPDAAASTLLMLRPFDMTDALLAASSVPENDAPVWGAGIAYALGGRVIRAGSHRVFESLTAGNVGHDPLASPAQWLDVGPTNRWSMFDEALGTLTTAAGGTIVMTFDSNAAEAVALLDVAADAVQVEVFAPGEIVPEYDRTIPANGGAVTFLDLPAIEGTVRVTLTAAGEISVGTLLIGELIGLGITEASPTAGITDFSRKQVDDFGEVTIVQRAWAKRMAARALIRTDAIDVTADRIASVRARPVLWIGGEGLDSITVYGFFRDFSIEVGETVSKLSLSIEGLSKAQPLEAPWAADIADVRAKIARIASDGFLNAGEKPAAVIDYNALQADLNALNARYVALGSPSDITPSHDAAGAAFATLSAYLTALAPAWTDTAQDTPIVAATYQLRWVDAYSAVAAFMAAITGRAGTGGLSGQSVTLVKIYKRAPAGSPPALPTTTGTFDFAAYTITGLNNGWTIGIPAANGQPLYVSAAPAITTPPASTDTIAAGEWAACVIDSQDGANGGNGTGGIPVVLYARNNTGIAPATPSATLTVDLLTGVVTGTLGVWSQSAPDPALGRYLYQTTAAGIATAPATTDTIATGEWAAAKQILQDGTSPPPGLTVALVKIYKRAPAGSPPALPTTTGTFDLAAYTMTGLNNGWTIAVPAANGNPLFVSAAPAIATAPATTDTIAAGEWASPVIDSQDGANGGNGTAGIPVLLYARNDTGVAPATPGATLTVDLLTGAITAGALGVWSQSAPDPALGRFLYQTSAAAIATFPATTDTIAAGEWAAAKQIVKDGDDGTPGDPGDPGPPGTSVATVNLYIRTATATPPAVPAGTTTFTFATAVLSGALGGWAQSMPATGGGYRWQITAPASGTGTTDAIASGEWSAPALIGQDGAAGSAVYAAQSVGGTLGSVTVNYPQQITLGNGATQDVSGEIRTNSTNASGGSVRAQIQYAPAGSGSWSVAAQDDAGSDWDWFADGTRVLGFLDGSFTNSSGATQVYDLRIVLTKIGGTVTLTQSGSFFKPG